MRTFLGFLLMAAPLGAGAAENHKVTFNQQIAPIIYRNCSECHRPDEAAPFSLLNYKDVSKKGATIAKVIGSHVMPPWKADPASFPYRGERRLTDAEIKLVQAWVKDGMPEGPGQAPEPPKFASGWRLGEPDLIVEMPAGYHIPAEGPDIYRNIAVPLGLKEDQWLAAIDLRPTARTAVHHLLYFADPKGLVHQRPSTDGQPGFNGMRAGGASVSLGGWAVGGQPQFFPEGLALKVPKGSDLVVQYHFHPTGKAEVEKSVIGLYFAKKAPTRTLTRVQMPPDYSLFSGLDIPAGQKDFVIRDSYTLPVGIDAVGIGAHAHYIATKMKMTATLPDGAVKTLLTIGDWDFAWQDRYYFKEFVSLPKGTKLDVEIHWDNSTDNTRNPSRPPIAVSWGEQTRDEMGSVSLMAVPQQEADLKILSADQRKRRDEMAKQKMQSDPAFALKVMKMLSN
jgi:hypothetical protein